MSVDDSHSGGTIFASFGAGCLILVTVVPALLILGAGHAFAEGPRTRLIIPVAKLEEQVSCSEDILKAIEISSGEVKYTVEIPELATTPIIHSSPVCRRFLSEWFEDLREANKQELIFELRFAGARRKIDLYRDVSTDLYDACVRLGYCMQDAFDYFQLNPEIVSCRPKESWSSLLKRMMPRIRRPNYEVIHDVEVEIFPFVPFTEKFKEYLALDKQGATFVSSMTMGQGTGYELSVKLRDLQKDIFIALGAGVLFATAQGSFLAEHFHQHPTMLLLPITSGAEFKTIYHWKMIFNAKGDRSSFSAMNLSTPLKTPFTDLIYSFSDVRVTDELRALLSSAMASQCESFSSYKCFVDFSHPDVQVRQKLYWMFLDTCERLKEHLAKKPVKRARKRFFMQPQDTDLVYLAKQLINEAKEEVIVLTHKFTLPEVMEYLKEAAQRGVRVHVLASRPAGMKPQEVPDFYYSFGDKSTTRRVPEPHMKLMIVDRKKMFFGTGNFSRNAFHHARELFAVTDDRQAIDKVLRVVAFLRYSQDPSQRETFGLKPLDEAWVVSKESDVARVEASWSTVPPSKTEEPGKDWLKHYRRVQGKAYQNLEQCGLRHLLIIPETDYRSCLSQGESDGLLSVPACARGVER